MRTKCSVACEGLAVCLLVLLSPGSMAAMVMGGKEKLPDLNWPEGMTELVNHPDRKSYGFGNGLHWFWYKSADMESVNQALQILSRIKVPKLQLTLTDLAGTKKIWIAPEMQASYGPGIPWMLEVWDRKSWHSLYNNPEFQIPSHDHAFGDPPPPLEITLPVGEGGVVWDQLKIPKNLLVIDKRTALQSKADMEIHGVVRDMVSGQGIAGATVTVGSDCLTDNEGRFLLKRKPGQDLMLSIQAKGYATREWFSKVNPCCATHEIVIELCRSMKQEILVTDLDGNPVQDATLYIPHAMGIDGLPYSYQANLTTNASGEVVAEELPQGYAIIRCLASTKGYQDHPTIFTEIPVQEDIMGIPDNIPPTPLRIHLIKVRGGTLRGRFTNAKGEPVLASNSVQAMGTADFSGGHADGHATVGPDGVFEIKDLPAGNYRVTCWRPVTEKDTDVHSGLIGAYSSDTIIQVKENAVTDLGTLMVKE